jgi:uncharacterized membrane protein YbhN (UPF0104 family)
MLPALWSGTAVDTGLEAGVWLSIALFVTLIGAVVVATRDRVLVGMARGAQRIVDMIGRGKGPHDLVAQAITQRDLLRDTIRHRRGRAFAATMGQSLAAYLALYVVLLSAGIRPNVIVVLAAFAVANIAGMIPFTPAGLGFVEAGLAGVLSTGGVPYSTALLVTVAYRVVSSWLPALVGLVAFGVVRPGRRARRIDEDQQVVGLEGLRQVAVGSVVAGGLAGRQIVVERAHNDSQVGKLVA